MELKNKFILITGANRGIGKAFAAACANEKAHLILALRKNEPELILELKNEGALSVEVIQSDLSTRNGVEELIKKVLNKKIDILFNNAGMVTGGLLEEQNLDDIYQMLQVNINALMHLTHGILPQLIKQKSGKIINHSSVTAVMHFPCASTYSASKAAVLAFTNCLQQELKGTGVSTLCLITPAIKTRMLDQITDIYSKNLEVPTDYIAPDVYAKKIIQAIKNDSIYLEPSGKTAVGMTAAKYFRGVFNWGVSTAFKR